MVSLEGSKLYCKKSRTLPASRGPTRTANSLVPPETPPPVPDIPKGRRMPLAWPLPPGWGMRTIYGSGNTPIPRPRLEALLESVPSFPVTVVWGPPGGGKRTLLESSLGRTGLPVWTARLPRGIPLPPGAPPGPDLQFRITDSPDPGPIPTLSESVEQWRSRRERGVLLLEGGPLPPDRWRALVPPMLLESPPRGLSLVPSRGRPKLPLGKRRLAGQLLEIGPDLLRLDRSETHALLAATGISTLPTEAIEAIHRIAGGWISGVLLCSLHVRSSNEPEQAVRTFGENPLLQEFLRQEVLEDLPPTCSASPRNCRSCSPHRGSSATRSWSVSNRPTPCRTSRNAHPWWSVPRTDAGACTPWPERASRP